jgi:Flp pilus assembly protein TadD
LPSHSLFCWARSNRCRAEKNRNLKLLIVRESRRPSKSAVKNDFQRARTVSAAANLALCFVFLSFPQASRAALEQEETPATRNDPRLALESAQSLAKQERFPEAIALYQRALILAPRNEPAEIGLSDAYRGVHNYEEARAILQTARRQHPKSVAVLSALGSLEIEAESYDTAIEALRGAVALAPDDAPLRNLLGTAYLSKGQSTAALVEFEKVLARDPANQLAKRLRRRWRFSLINRIFFMSLG